MYISIMFHKLLSAVLNNPICLTIEKWFNGFKKFLIFFIFYFLFFTEQNLCGDPKTFCTTKFSLPMGAPNSY